MEPELDLAIDVAALLWYLYRSVGCPFGESLSGMEVWVEINMLEPLRKQREKDGAEESDG